jgi:hypothetical protein
MTPVHVPHKLPVILSREEVARLIESAGSLKYQAALSMTYGARLRASEVIALKVGDIDSQRMVLRVERGRCPSPRSLPTGLRRCATANGSSMPPAGGGRALHIHGPYDLLQRGISNGSRPDASNRSAERLRALARPGE